MSDQTAAHQLSNRKLLVWGVSLLLLAGVCLAWPEHAANTAKFVLWGLIVVAPIVIPGIVLAAWIIASGADTHIAGAFEGKTLRTVLAASLIGAITPVCGVTVLPLMAGLMDVQRDHRKLRLMEIKIVRWGLGPWRASQ